MNKQTRDLTPAERSRYSRHILLEEMGVEGQRRLASARILVIGAGGLGSPAALYLAAAGIGTLGIADFDRVEEHNLQRQILHDTASVGKPKSGSAAVRLRALNPHIQVREHAEPITAANAGPLFLEYDIVVDGTDNFAARYLVNDAAVITRRPLVHGSVFKFEGQVSVFDPARGGPCYRCLFPVPPPPGSVPNCGESGVIGALCGVIGSLQALEAVKLAAGFGEPLRGAVLTHDALAQSFTTLRFERDPGCPACGDRPAILDLRADRYDFGCGTGSAESVRRPVEAGVPMEISATEAADLLRQAPGRTLLVDVREPYELAICSLAGAEVIPMMQLGIRFGELPRDKHLLVICHTGYRSLHATQFLRAQGISDVSNVAGGVDAWSREVDPTLPRY